MGLEDDFKAAEGDVEGMSKKEDLAAVGAIGVAGYEYEKHEKKEEAEQAASQSAPVDDGSGNTNF
ncbi:hypothetical protein FRB97_003953 [Tulasnella sp. 331]|nr:hypothetical protein FRB97_003953 [Tulasnella sp. 331]KAG8878238.1 hypothetical protein FRB98_006304 [Tulasnella sp. 332]